MNNFSLPDSYMKKALDKISLKQKSLGSLVSLGDCLEILACRRVASM